MDKLIAKAVDDLRQIKACTHNWVGPITSDEYPNIVPREIVTIYYVRCRYCPLAKAFASKQDAEKLLAHNKGE